jgi:hypothetical protein
MKKILWLSVLVLSACASPAQKACTKMLTLCKQDASEAPTCAADLEAFDKQNRTLTAQQFSSCTENASTCVEASGCAVGAGLSSVKDLGGQFLQGLQKGLGK